MTHEGWRALADDMRKGLPRATGHRLRGAAAIGLLALAGAAVGPGCAGNSEINASAGNGSTTGAGGGISGSGSSTASMTTASSTGASATVSSSSGTTGAGGHGGGAGTTTGEGGGTETTGTTTGAGGSGGTPNCGEPLDAGNDGGFGVCAVPGGVGLCAEGEVQCVKDALACVPNKPTNEICNGKDDNCNGMVDEGDPGGGGMCMAAGAFGICANGTMHCLNGALQCEPAMPMPEICDGLDNNCNGQIDEGPIANPLMQCNSMLPGICATGHTKCVEGANPPASAAIQCVADIMPGMYPESCNGLDNDCDGVVGNNIPGVGGACTVKDNLGQPLVGECAAGTVVCPKSAPFIIGCVGPGPSPEICDGLDNNCNGQVDEGDPGGGMPCMVPGQLGVCANGVTHCIMGAIQCVQTVQPSPEICDGLDNDCNGIVDDIPNVNTSCAGQNPGAVNVTSWACTMGACTIATCNQGYGNIGGTAGGGCSCFIGSYGQVCSDAAASVQSVSKGQTVTTSGVITVAGGANYIQFQFTDPGAGAVFHPQLSLSNDGSGLYTMDVTTDCNNTPPACPTAGDSPNATGLHTWEMDYDFAAPGQYVAGVGCCNDSLTPRVTTVIAKVYLTGANPAVSCTQFTITATNP